VLRESDGDREWEGGRAHEGKSVFERNIERDRDGGRVQEFA